MNEEIYDLIALPYFSLNLGGEILDANRAAAKLLQIKKSDIIQCNFKSLLTNHTLPNFEKFLEDSFSKQSYQICEVQVLVTDFQIIFLRLEGVISPIGDKCLVTAINITDSKLAELSSLSVQADMESILEAIPDLLFELDLNGKFYSYHCKNKDLLVAEPSIFLGRRIQEVMPIDIITLCREAIQAANETGHVSGIQYEILIGKEIKQFEMSVTKKKNKYIDQPRFWVMCRDITEEQVLRKALRQSEERYRGLLNNLNAGVVIHAPDTSILMNNERASELLGLSDAELRGKSSISPDWHFLLEDNSICPLELFPVNQIIDKRQEIKNQIFGIVRPKKKDTVWVEVNGIPFFSSNGNITEIAISFADITEKRLSEIEIKKREKNYRMLMEQAVDGIFISDHNQKYIDVNHRACEMLGYSREELLNLNISDLFLKEELNKFPLQIDKILAGQTVLSERYLLRKDGTTIPVEINAKLIEDGIMQAIVRDISDRNKIEKALLISEANMKAVLDNSLEAILFFDKNRTIQFFNELAYNLAKQIYKVEIKIGNLIYDLISNHAMEVFEHNFQLALTGKRIISEQSFGDGKESHWFEIQYAPVKNKSQEIIGILFSAQDISEKKKSQQLLKQSELRFHAIFDRAPLGIALLESKSGKFVQVNPKFCEMLNYNPVEILNLSFLEITHPDDLYENMDSLRLFLDGKTPLISLENRYIRKDSSNIWVNAIYVPLNPDLNDGDNLHIAIASDITETKLAHEQAIKYTQTLVSLNATKDKFFSIISHDLRNPFSGIIGLSEMMDTKLKEEEFSVNEIRKFAQLINASSKSAFALLENLMQWAKSQTGEIRYSPEKVSIGELIDITLQVLIGSAFKKKIEIIKNIEEDIKVFADPALTNTVLRNLIGNAIKFSYPNSSIFITTQIDGEFLAISISDRGIGISADNLHKLFRIDSKFTKLGTDSEKGTGLGLILCKEFVEKQYGNIWVESEIGKGSKFTFALPLARI